MLSVNCLQKNAVVVAALMAMACGSDRHVGTTMPSLLSGHGVDDGLDWSPPGDGSSELTTSGRLSEYLVFALNNSPETRSAFERWRAARFRISRNSRLPEPTISFGYYLRSVETKVGPQRYKIGVSQVFPWPGKLRAAEDAASEKAAAAAQMVDANVLSVRREVTAAYWKLWLVAEEHMLKTEHDAILEAMAGVVRGRVQTGAATLAELNQIDLNIARHHDHREGHEEAARRASANLRAAVGAVRARKILMTTDSPQSGLPNRSAETLALLSRRHPVIAKFTHLASGDTYRAKMNRADRYPRLKLGLDLIGTGDASSPTKDSGKDAVIVSVGLSIPLWGGSYSDAEQAATATAESHRAMEEASLRRSEAMLESALSQVRDAQRRIELYEKTLLPQAEATFQAVLGGYQSGRSTVASVIIAQRDLIELRIEHARSRADRAIAWADLEFITGIALDVKGGSHE